MNDKTTFTIRLAKATPEDVESAMTVATIVEGLHKGQHPGDGDYFDEDDHEHLRALYDHLVTATTSAGGGLFRVAAGMHTVLANDILDPNDDCLALHPRLQPVVWEAPSEELDRALKAADLPDASADTLRQAARTLRAEVLFRWEQRTALSFRLQALQRALIEAGIDDQSQLYQRLHDLTATAEAWMHAGTLTEAADAHIHALSGLLLGPPTEAMRIAGFESEAFEALTDAVCEEKGWPYSCAQSADLCAAIFQAMAIAAVKGRPGARFIGIDMAGGPDVHVEDEVEVDGQGRITAVREVPRA